MRNDLKETDVKHRTDLLPVKVYRTAHVTYHWHDEIEFIITENSPVTVVIAGEQIRVEVGDAVMIEAKELHSITDCTSTITAIVVHPNLFSDGESDIFGGNIHFKRYFSQKDHTDRQIIAFLRTIPDLISNQDTFWGFRVKTAFCNVFDIMLQNKQYFEKASRRSNYCESIKTITDYIHENYSQKLSLNDLCALSHFSRSFLIKIFKENTGKTPTEYINRYRLQISCEMLSETEKSILDIALDCGFPSVGYFIRCFKLQFGITPGQYRKQRPFS